MLCIIFLLYTFIWGLYTNIPALNILEQSIRNLFFHVPMWFAMIFMTLASVVYGMMYLNKGYVKYDIVSSQLVTVGFIFGILGLLTGSIWARVTWGAWWSFNEVKLNASAAGVLTYAAYFILRSSFEDDEKKARFSAVYNIFAFVMFFVFIMVIPRLEVGSLHPGNGGNPGFSAYDLDNRLRIIFYPAVIGWTLVGGWIAQLMIRYKLLERKKLKLD